MTAIITIGPKNIPYQGAPEPHHSYIMAFLHGWCRNGVRLAARGSVSLDADQSASGVHDCSVAARASRFCEPAAGSNAPLLTMAEEKRAADVSQLKPAKGRL
jgi:hypothetical protein